MIHFNGKSQVLRSLKRNIKKTVLKIISDHKKELIDLGYVFVDDEELRKINIESLDHDYYTDIITFDYGSDNHIEGEIYISLDRVKDNAEKFKQTFHVELLRVIFHGALHLVGYQDKTKSQKEKMRKMEDLYIKEHLKHVPRGTRGYANV